MEEDTIERLKLLCADMARWEDDNTGMSLAGIIRRAQKLNREFDPIVALIDDLMAQDISLRDKIVIAYEAGRNTPA